MLAIGAAYPALFVGRFKFPRKPAIRILAPTVGRAEGSENNSVAVKAAHPMFGSFVSLISFYWYVPFRNGPPFVARQR